MDKVLKLKKLGIAAAVLAVLAVFLPASPADAARVKDIARVQGVRSNQLVGYGLVVGLAGTGDSSQNTYTIQSIINMLKSFGITFSAQQLQPKNVGAVMVTAQLPPFVKPGDTIDVTVSSMGDAKSLQGGTLIQTPLRAANGAVYAVAQGALSVGGYAVSAAGSGQQKNFPTVGLIPNGAIVEREVPMAFANNGVITLSLMQPDFTTAARITEAIAGRFGGIARAVDAGTITVNVPPEYADDVVSFVSAVEDLEVTPEAVAKVVVNERTGTVVIGEKVTIDEVAVAQGGLTVRITSHKEVSQPPPLSPGSTVVTENANVKAEEKSTNLIVVPKSPSVGDLVRALNAVGATPRDIIAILQAIKTAGALHAELQVI